MTMRTHRLVIAAACCVAVHGVAGAQSQPGASQETGSLVKRAPSVVIDGRSLAAAREATRQFGACVVSRRPQFAQNIMKMPVDDPQYEKLIRRLATDDCMADGFLRMPVGLFRTAVFEAAYAKEFGRAPVADLKSVPTVDYIGGYARPLSTMATTTIALALMGDCLARADSKAAHALVSAKPGTASEDAAFADMLRPLPACVPKGETIRFSKPVVRGAIVEGLYRLRRAKVAVQGERP